MKRAIPVVVLSIAGLVPVWLYQPSADSSTVQATTPAPSSSSSSSGASGASGTNVVTSSTIDTEKGLVQLQVTFDGTKITTVKMLQQPDHPQTEAAVPKLVAETLEAQSADIDTVSGATITSEAYKKSLQATIDDNAKTASAPPSASASEASSRTVDGSALSTEKGPVQVQATFVGTKITAVRMLQQPNHPQTEAAVPKLVAETLEAQSADIDTVSGATITSDAYKESLQAAIDAKG
ncbi:FMN-binding protein [Streptomyces sp. NPDC005402]|uniref:FMN-binding protein n=1 Tax=Streptomyces sp. NPDC005402 TaxID=3155338 RepID=UPI0033B15319